MRQEVVLQVWDATKGHFAGVGVIMVRKRRSPLRLWCGKRHLVGVGDVCVCVGRGEGAGRAVLLVWKVWLKKDHWKV